MFRLHIISFCLFLLSCCLSSCRKFLEVGAPVDKVTSNFVYQSNISAAAVLTGIYFDLQRAYPGFSHGPNGISIICGLSADELSTHPLSPYSLIYENSSENNLWTPLYSFIYRANAALEGISASNSLSEPVKNQLIGEAKFIRAFCYFYLVNLYGDVPLLITSDYRTNSSSGRMSRADVYKQIILDLESGNELMDNNYLSADASSISEERIRPNRWVAKALLARVYLYTKDWIKAEMAASELIDNRSAFDTTSLSDVFLSNSKEAIWQLQIVGEWGYKHSLDAQIFVPIYLQSDGFIYNLWINDSLEKSFEAGDKRKSEWTIAGRDTIQNKDYYFPYKYKHIMFEDPPTEYVMVFRLAEQYLIRAEARIEQGKVTEGKADINLIRKRAGLIAVDASSTDELLRIILQERRVELFSEWGHRWLDLKRTGEVDSVMEKVCPSKNAIWYSYKQLFAIPIFDLEHNINLKQNDGYPSK